MGEGSRRKLQGRTAIAVSVLAALTTLYEMWAVLAFPEPILHRALSFGAFFALCFLLYTTPGSTETGRVPWYDWVLAGGSVGVAAYIALNTQRLVHRFAFCDPVTVGDLILGLLAVVLLLEGSRRIVGPWLSILSVLSLGYVFLGPVIPGLFGHQGFSLRALIDELFLTTDGIWGDAMGIAVTYIILFIIFGAFLQLSGGGNFLFEFASALAGWARGGLAKVAVIASGLFGMISGSPVANASSVGAITIPMMRKAGYPADFAAATETCASTGGTIMPPVMGSVAFLMAQVLGVPYIKVAIAAAIPAVIYYFAVFVAVDLRAARLGLKGLPRDKLPPLGKTLAKGAGFFIPLVFLVYRLMAGFSPSRVALETTLVTVLVSWLRPDTRMGVRRILEALENGARSGIMVVVTLATSGIMIGVINLTGVGTKFSSFLMACTGGEKFVALALTMVLTLIMGLAMNITPSYLFAAVVSGPLLVSLGVPPMAAHMFILFFAALATMTPPVASTAFAAAGIAGADPMRVGFLACRIGLVAYLLPFAFAYEPALLLLGSPAEVLWATALTLVGVVALAVATEGWLGGEVHWFPRALIGIAGPLLVIRGWQTDVVGLALLAMGLLLRKKFRAPGAQTVKPPAVSPGTSG